MDIKIWSQIVLLQIIRIIQTIPVRTGTLFILLTVGLSVGFTAKAQNDIYSYLTYSVKEGLPSNETYCVIEDRTGSIWISTDRGVVRFNGRRFEVFTVKDGLPDNTVFKMYEDHKGRIWFMTYNGKLGYYFQNKFYTIDVPGEGRALIERLRVTKEDSVMFFCQKPPRTTYKFVLKNHKLEPGSLKIEQADIKKEMGWLPDSIRQTGIYNVYKHHPDWASKFQELNSQIYKCDAGIRSLISEKYVFKIVKNAFLTVSGMDKQVLKVYKEEILEENPFSKYTEAFSGIGIVDDKVFVTKINGLIRFYSAKPPFENTKSLMLKNAEPSYVCRDRFGGLWITTLNKGVLYIPNSELEVTIVTDPDIEIKQFARNKYVAFTSNNRLENRRNRYPSENKAEGTILFDDKISVNDMYICNDQFVLSHSHGFITADSMGNNLTFVPDTNQPLHSKVLGSHYMSRYAAQQMDDGTWITLDYAGVYIEGDSIYENKNKMSAIREMLYRKDTAWIGGLNGLFAFDLEHKEYVPEVRADTLLHNRITGFCSFSNYGLAMASPGVGVIIRNGSKYYLIEEGGELKGQSYSKVVSSNDSTIWAMGIQGVSRIRLKSFSPLKYTVENLGKESGFLGAQINDIYYFDDTIYAAIENKVYKINCDYEPSNYIPELNIRTITINNQTTEILEAYDLSYDQNSLDLILEVKYLPNAKEVVYLYRINESDEWKERSLPELNLLNLQSGTYDVYVKARLPNGLETGVKKISFTIRPPFWMTIWAIIGYVLLLVFALWFVFRIRLKRARKEESMRRKVAEMELKALRSQMNPHFTFNTMNSIQHFINSNNPEQASAYITSFSRLMRMILDNSREEFVTVEQELDALKLYLEIEKLRFQGKFEYVIEVDEDIDETFERMPPLVIQPYVENAIWHGLMPKDGDRKLSIKLFRRKGEEGVLCMVEDNGVGRKKAQENKSKFRTKHKSHGMNITQTRLELLNEMNNEKLAAEIIDLYDDNDVPAGTRVEIFIPTK